MDDRENASGAGSVIRANWTTVGDEAQRLPIRQIDLIGIELHAGVAEHGVDPARMPAGAEAKLLGVGPGTHGKFRFG